MSCCRDSLLGTVYLENVLQIAIRIAALGHPAEPDNVCYCHLIEPLRYAETIRT